MAGPWNWNLPLTPRLARHRPAQLGDTEAAIAQLQQALASDPDNAGAHSTLADAYFRQGNLDEAATHYLAALGNEETAFTTQLASIYSVQNRPEDAMRTGRAVAAG